MKTFQNNSSTDSKKRNQKKNKKNAQKKVYNDKAKKDTGKLASRVNLRMKIVSGLVAACMVFLVVYIGVRSAMTNEGYERKALSQMNYSSSTLVAKSGEIYDANMTPIAVSKRVYILILDPKVILETEDIGGHEGTLETTIKALNECFGLDTEDLRDTITSSPEKSYLRYVPSGTSDKKFLVSEDEKAVFDALQAKVNGTETETSEAQTEVEKMSAQAENSGSENVQTQAALQTSPAEEESYGPKGAKITGVWFETEYQRYYPYDDLASKVIGFTTKDSSEGLWGLERYYNEELRGTNGRSYSYIDSNENLIREVIEPTDGYSLVSTIDMNLTKLISDAVESWFNETDENGQKIRSAKSYSILAMDPNTGAVKAMVTDTDYDLNNPSDLSAFYTEEEIAAFADNAAKLSEYEKYLEEKEEEKKAVEENGDSNETSSQTQEDMLQIALASPYAGYLTDDGEWDHDLWPTTTDAQNAVWRNGIISNSFEPGSTGKVITYAAALEEGLITQDTMFDDSEGFLTIGRTMVKCHNYATGGCGLITAKEAVAQSCNVAFMEIGEMLGAELFVKYQELHNLGQKTGIDLPGEASCEGLLYTADQLGDLELATISFGQCYNVTMIQMAAAFCADINGGYYYKPYVVQSILDEDGNTAESAKPTLVRQVISEETSAVVREALEYAVTDGTVYGIQIGNVKEGIKMDGYHFGGKTGTAQKLPRSEEKYAISVISAAPIDAPQLVLYVVLDEYEGELADDGSAPVQYLSGLLWYTIKDYIGLYSDLDPDVNSYDWSTQAEDDGMAGESIFTDSEGDLDALPVPPAAAAEQTDPVEENAEDAIIDPDAAIVSPLENIQ